MFAAFAIVGMTYVGVFNGGSASLNGRAGEYQLVYTTFVARSNRRYLCYTLACPANTLHRRPSEGRLSGSRRKPPRGATRPERSSRRRQAVLSSRYEVDPQSLAAGCLSLSSRGSETAGIAWTPDLRRCAGTHHLRPEREFLFARRPAALDAKPTFGGAPRQVDSRLAAAPQNAELAAPTLLCSSRRRGQPDVTL
jgi:hypothetical protein